MSTEESRVATELRFELPAFEPDATLVEQLSALAVAPTKANLARKRIPKRAAAGVFAGLLLASGTAYAAHEQIEPVLNSIVGGNRPEMPRAPQPSMPPTGSGAATSNQPSPAGGASKGGDRLGQRDGGAANGEDQQPSSGETELPPGSDGGAQSTTSSSADSSGSPSDTSSPGETTSTSDGGGSSSGSGTSGSDGGSSGSLDGSSTGQ